MRTSLLALLAISFSNIFAQEVEPTPLSRTVFKLSPQHFIHNSLKAGIERFNADHSGSFAFFLTGRLENNEESFYLEGYNGLAGELQFRKYISPMSRRVSKKGNWFHQGVYAAGYVQGGVYAGDFRSQYGYFDPNTGNYVTHVSYNYTERIVNGGLGFMMGYQKTLWQVVFVEGFIGGGIQLAERSVSGDHGDNAYDYYTGIVDPGYKGILPKIGLNIGIGL